MTLLTICQGILKETKASSIPDTIISNNEDVAKQILEVLRVSIVELARDYDWQELQKETTFASVLSTEGYNLPSDFDRFINDTFWNSTRMRPVNGPMTPKEWRILKNSTISGSTTADFFRIRRGQTLLFPIPQAGENYIYEYISNQIVLSNAAVGQTNWLADSDVPAIDEYIVRLDATWRWLKNQGRPFAQEKIDANLAIAERVRVNGARKTIRHGTTYRQVRIGYPTTIQPA